MKHLIVRTLAVLGLMVAGLALTASAQSTQITTNVPFDFSFAGKTFPAGEYTLVKATENVLALRDSRKRTIALSLTQGLESITPSDSTKLKFRASNGKYYLSEVWKQTDSSGIRMYPPVPRTEVATRRSVEAIEAAGGSQP